MHTVASYPHVCLYILVHKQKYKPSRFQCYLQYLNVYTLATQHSPCSLYHICTNFRGTLYKVHRLFRG